uniref:Sphingomyelin phosphodiesterase C-terminal domain-containing protein n=1 Tax=Neogobius melanostomus TaxID=47308 RepID=A0A8C6S4N9_9GOBI
ADPRPTVCASSKGSNSSAPECFGELPWTPPYRLLLSALRTDSPPHVPALNSHTDLVVEEFFCKLTTSIKKTSPNINRVLRWQRHDYWPQVIIIAHVYFIKGDNNRSCLFYKVIIIARVYFIKVIIIARVYFIKVIIRSRSVGFLPFARNTTAIHVIVGQFYGHTHRDSVMVMRDGGGAAVNAAFVAPAVTPIRNVHEPTSNNPGLRVYLLNQYYRIQDLWQFYLNLTEANVQQRAQWRVGYVMTQEYGLKDLSPASLLALGLSLVPPQSRSFQTYFRHFNVEFDPRLVCCGQCHALQVCAVLNPGQSGYQDCLTGLGLNQD